MHKVKRERSTNFSSDERDLLVSLVEKYKDILENKQSDGAAWKKKEMAWELIENQFNAQTGSSFRTKKTLRIKYEGLKRTVRKKSAAIRSELYRTGGGPNTATPLDGTEQHIKSMISLSTDGLESIYDSDVLPPDASTITSVPPDASTITSVPPDASTITSVPPIPNEDDTMQLPMEEYVILKPISEDSELVTKTDLDKQHMHINETTVEESFLIKTINNDKELEAIPSGSTPVLYKKWDVTSRKQLRTKKHPALIANTPSESKKSLDKLTEAKLELIRLQKQLLEAEIIEKKKEWEFNEKERQWKEGEYKLKLDKLRKELKE